MTEPAFTQAKHFRAANRGKGDIRLIVLHTMQYPERPTAAEWAAGFFRDPHGPKGPVTVSAHYNIDDDSITHSVREKDIAFHAGPVNGYSLGFEHAGYAQQTAAEWRDEFSTRMLERSAALAAQACKRYDIPIIRRTERDLAEGRTDGFCGHDAVTKGLNFGSHWDPGPHFPYAWYLERVRAHMDDPVELEPEVGTDKVVVSDLDEVFAHANLSEFVEVVHDGATYLVCPFYFAPVGIGEAVKLAKDLGCELPTPGLVDAIWRQADLKIDANEMVRAGAGHDGTMRSMNDPDRIAKVIGKLGQLVDAHGPYRLLAGAFKDVVIHNGKVGLYGWHRPDGTRIQGFFGGHVMSWRDYSQGLRFVRRVG